MQKQLTLVLAALALGFGTASVAADSSYSDWDDNGDGNITTDEFYGSASDWGIYSDYDLDNDGLYNEAEWNEFDWDYDYATWDTNDDGFIDSGEYYDGVFTTFDANEDGHWDEGEWDDAGEAGVFDL